jgi:predicted DNA-binding transcriptional regulator AlpA
MNQIGGSGIELWKAKRVRKIVPWGRTTLWQKSRSGEFPRPVKLGNNTIAWRSDEVMAWIQSRQRA